MQTATVATSNLGQVIGLKSKRKVALLVAFMFSCLVGTVHAEKVAISGTHSKDEIKSTCEKAGGESWDVGGSYGCVNECKNSSGGLGVCGVSCTNGKCSGTVPDRIIPGTDLVLQGLLKGKVPVSATQK